MKQEDFDTVTQLGTVAIKTIIIFLALIIAVGVGVYWYSSELEKATPNTPAGTTNTQSQTNNTEMSDDAEGESSDAEETSDEQVDQDTQDEVTKQEVAQLLNMDQATPEAEMYYSQDLGIAFSYAPIQSLKEFIGNYQIEVTEKENTIYVHRADGTYEDSGQHVTILKKDSETDPQDFFDQEFKLNDSEYCSIKKNDTSSGQNTDTFKISIDDPRLDDLDHYEYPNPELCPDQLQPYAFVGGVSYFQYDPEQPEYILHFSIGQAGIADSGLEDEESWYDTIKIVEN